MRHLPAVFLALLSLCTVGCQTAAPRAGTTATSSPGHSAAAETATHGTNVSLPAGAAYNTELHAAAPPAATAVDTPRWRHVVSFYGWVPNLKGDVTVRGLDAEPSITRGDVLDDLDLAFSGRYEVQPPDSDWSFFGDIFHARISDDESADTAAVGRVDADFEARMTFIEAGAILHVWESSETTAAYDRETSRTKFDLYGGARYSRMKMEVDVKAKAVGFKRGFDKSGDWTDPLVGARVRHGLTPRLWLIARGDLGGFDVGSHRTWTATGTLQFLITEDIAVGAGWRVMDIDYDDGPDADIRMSGPFVTLSYDF